MVCNHRIAKYRDMCTDMTHTALHRYRPMIRFAVAVQRKYLPQEMFWVNNLFCYNNVILINNANCCVLPVEYNY